MVCILDTTGTVPVTDDCGPWSSSAALVTRLDCPCSTQAWKACVFTGLTMQIKTWLLGAALLLTNKMQMPR